MPYDTDGEFREPTITDKAGFAKVALQAYAGVTHHDVVDLDDTDSLTELTTDLLADLQHLLGEEFEPAMHSAMMHYLAECAEQAANMADWESRSW